ncbi:MAG: ribulose-phosphate 3-epimerase [Actinobacteria bacterium]|nr:ribulose-phosphate 3-epimerase [Actinomycetota bacterium]MCL5446988.1 ribulose-phosphate 3-epimerase [Actinomycetota bacterium]
MTDSRNIGLAPSILSADFSFLGEAVRSVEQSAGWIHVDVMDGHFVPTITMGPLAVQSLVRLTSVPIECHLMIDNPWAIMPQFAQAGAARCTVHVETGRTAELAGMARALGISMGVALNPETPAAEIYPYLDSVDLVLVMTVNPGFGGQQFMPEVLPKLAEISSRVSEMGLEIDVEVDGGIGPGTVGQVVAAGANILVAGSAIFSAGTSPAAAAEKLIRVAMDAGVR